MSRERRCCMSNDESPIFTETNTGILEKMVGLASRA